MVTDDDNEDGDVNKMKPSRTERREILNAESSQLRRYSVSAAAQSS